MRLWTVVPGMVEDGLHGQDVFYVVREGDSPANDDCWFSDPEDAQAHADELNEDAPRAHYEGFWSRFTCESCSNVFEVEGDVSSGEAVECDMCLTRLVVEGR